MEAIGHYSAAIVADRKDPTLPLNRAAAYLKLGKCVSPHLAIGCWFVECFHLRRNEDAERDCTTSLSIKPRQVKALYRRAQAKIASQKLAEALKGVVLHQRDSFLC